MTAVKDCMCSPREGHTEGTGWGASAKSLETTPGASSEVGLSRHVSELAHVA